MTQKTNPWTFDVRVRERNLKAGSLTDKDVEKYLSQLPDNADQAEAFGTAQPALEQPELPDDLDDDIDDEDEGDDEVADVAAASDDGNTNTNTNTNTNGAVVGGGMGGGLGGGGGIGGGEGT